MTLCLEPANYVYGYNRRLVAVVRLKGVAEGFKQNRDTIRYKPEN